MFHPYNIGKIMIQKSNSILSPMFFFAVLRVPELGNCNLITQKTTR